MEKESRCERDCRACGAVDWAEYAQGPLSSQGVELHCEVELAGETASHRRHCC